MTAIKTANIVEGNLAQEPKYFPEGQYVARIVFRIMHTDRRLNPQTNQWEDGRTTAVDVNFYGPAAERYAQTIQQQPDVFAKGTAVVAWGELSDHPDTWDRPRREPTGHARHQRYTHHPQPARQPASRQPPASPFHQPAAIHQRGPGTGSVDRPAVTSVKKRGRDHEIHRRLRRTFKRVA